MPARYPFAAVLFDLDGVVIDTTELHYRTWREIAHIHGYSLTPAELLATNGRPANETIHIWFGNRMDAQKLALLSAEPVKRFSAQLATEPISPIAGVVEFAKALAAAKVPRAIVTSAVLANATLSLERIGLTGVFDVVITAADVERGKPDPEPYLKAAEQLGVSAAQCVVIEDSVAGIRAARAAGARCVGLTTTFPRETLAAEQPDWLVNDFNDLPAQLRP